MGTTFTFEEATEPKTFGFEEAVLPEEPPASEALQPKSSALRRWVGDPAVSLAKGVIGLPEAIVGLADIPTGGYAGKILEAGGYGFQPKAAKAALSELYSPEQKAAEANVQKANGFIPTIKAMAQNPSTIASTVLESAPSMVGGAGIARKLLTSAPKLSPLVAGATGEGAIVAGQTAEQLRQESETGLLTPKQAALSATSGAATGLIGVIGGGLAKRLGVTDIDTLLAGGSASKEAAKKGVIRRVIESAIAEGAIEELPQSAQEQIQNNIASNKLWDEGVAEAAASGLIAGLATGGAGGFIGGKSKPMLEPTEVSGIQDTAIPVQESTVSTTESEEPVKPLETVPLTPTRETTPAAPVTPAEAVSPSEITRIAEMSPAELQKKITADHQSTGVSMTLQSYDLARKITADDIPALQKLEDAAEAQNRSAMKESPVNFDAAMAAATKKQFLNEIIRYRKAQDIVNERGITDPAELEAFGKQIGVGELSPAKAKEQPAPAPAGPTVAGTETAKPETPASVAEPVASVAKDSTTVSDWTSATDDTATISETPKGKPTGQSAGTFPGVDPTELHSGVPLPRFANRKMSPLDKVTTTHSGKLQKSTDEARLAQREIKKAIPAKLRREAASIYREAGGDLAVLKQWEASAKQKWMRDGARDAQTLTPDEIALVNKAGKAYDVLEKRGQKYDVLKSHRDNYVTHIWNEKKPGTGWGGGALKQRFRFSKARTLNTFFEGDQAGFKKPNLDIGNILPAYLHEMNKVIADRQMVSDIAKGEMPDGSPMAVQLGKAQPVEGEAGKAVLVTPRAAREADTSDYRVMNDQPALSDWTWEGKDTAGKPVFVKADLALHPDVYRRVNSMIGQSALRTWYHEPVSGTAQIPRAIIRGLDTAQAAMKREMFGLLAPFHQVQEGTHGIGHQVNPFFGIPKIDLRVPAQLDAANHGLMLLPDRASSRVYLEGVGNKTSLLSRGIRKAGKAGQAISDVIDGYQDYLFHQYIPGLKFKTYEAMLGRNTKLYAEELKSGKMTEADVKITSAEQANAAYGHLNYALLDRNPTMQHMIQLAALAPDFLEARARFTGQGIKGLSSKVGHEQFKAIAILAAAQAGTAFILSNMLGVPYDPEHPFELVYKGRRYAMRSVPEDIFGLFKDTRQFLYARANPLTVKGGVQLATNLNYRGEKVTPLETMTELLAGYIPITARSLPGVRSLTETSRKNPVTPLQQLAGSLGLRISRYSPVSETYKLAGEWMDKQKLPRDRGSYPVSKYQQLRYALEDGDIDRARGAYAELKKTMKAKQISDGFKSSVNHPFTGSQASDAKFAASLKGYDRELYKQALRTRRNILNLYGRTTAPAP